MNNGVICDVTILRSPKSNIIYTVEINIEILILSFSYTLFINLYLIYSFAIIGTANIYMFVIIPIKVLEYGFFPNVINNPDIK